MDAGKKYVVVPWDFTSESEIALKHALQLAGVMGNGIMLLHTIHLKKTLFFKPKKVSEEEKGKLFKKLEDRAAEIAKENRLEVRIRLVEGDIRKIFPVELKRANANLVVMPFRQKFGKFCFQGTDFLNIMKDSIIPFIVVQKVPKHEYYKELVVPIEIDRKYKETIGWIIYLAHYYKCNVNLFKPFINESFAKKDMANNIYFTKKMLDKQGIVYGIKTAKKGQPFKKEVFRFAELIDADIVVMMAKRFREWIDKDKEIKLETPILVVPPRTDLIKYGSFS